jgi:hypothetical protein
MMALRRNQGFIVQVRRRISDLQHAPKYPELVTQDLRNEWITQLDSLFRMAYAIASNDPNYKEGDAKVQPADPRTRQLWAHVAAHVGLVMDHLSKGYDSRKFNEDLAKLEKLVDKIGEFQAKSAGKESRAQDAKSDETSNPTVSNV